MGNVIGVGLIAISVVMIYRLIKDEKNGSSGVNSAAADKDQEDKK